MNIENLNQAMTDLLSLSGAIAASVVDWQSGMVLASEAKGGFDIELASAGNAEVIKAKMATMKSLGLDGEIKDVLITLTDQLHIIRMVSSNNSLFLYLALDAKGTNLGLARSKMVSVEANL